MGNITAFDQLPSPLRSLNEDNMVVLLQYLDVADYVHLTATCRKFLHETLGPPQNNYFWAQLLNRPWQQPVASYPSIPLPLPQQPVPIMPPTVDSRTPTQRLINHVLQTTRNGRKFEVDGTPLDLRIPLDTLNKKLVGHFDFRNEIKMYFFKAKWATALTNQLQTYVRWTNARADVRVVEESINLQDYFVKIMQIKPNELVSDVTFVVDLGVDPASLETLRHMQLWSTFKLRRIVYVKSTVRAIDYSYMSRSRMPPPMHPMMQQPQPMPLYAGMPMPNPSYGGPGGPTGVPNLSPFSQSSNPQPSYPQPSYPYPVPQFNHPQPFAPPMPYGALPPQPHPPQPQLGFRPVQPPPIIGANGPMPPQQQQQQQQQQYRK